MTFFWCRCQFAEVSNGWRRSRLLNNRQWCKTLKASKRGGRSSSSRNPKTANEWTARWRWWGGWPFRFVPPSKNNIQIFVYFPAFLIARHYPRREARAAAAMPNTRGSRSVPVGGRDKLWLSPFLWRPPPAINRFLCRTLHPPPPFDRLYRILFGIFQFGQKIIDGDLMSISLKCIFPEGYLHSLYPLQRTMVTLEFLNDLLPTRWLPPKKWKRKEKNECCNLWLSEWMAIPPRFLTQFLNGQNWSINVFSTSNGGPVCFPLCESAVPACASPM